MEASLLFDYHVIIQEMKGRRITPLEARERFSFLINNEKRGKLPIGSWGEKTLWTKLKDDIIGTGVGKDIRFFYSPSVGFCLDFFEEDLEDGAVIIYERLLAETLLEDLRTVEDIAELVDKGRVSKKDAEIYIRSLLTKEIEGEDYEEVAFVHPDGAEYPERLWLWIGDLFLKGKITGVLQVWINIRTKKLELGQKNTGKGGRLILF